VEIFSPKKTVNILGENGVYTKLDFIGMNLSQLDGIRLKNFFAIMQLHVNTKREFAVGNMQHIFRVKIGILNNFMIYLQLSSEISFRTSLIPFE
jgi:hypothetical protein